MLRFAGDIAIVVQDEVNLKRALGSLDNILIGNYKIIINRENTDLIFCTKKFENINVKIDDNALKQLPKFKYLGSMITENGKNKEDVIQRIKESKDYVQ